MKVVLVSNYNLETVNDKLLEENLTEEYAKILASDWNDKHKNNDYYALVKEDDYKLYRFEP